MDITLLIPTLNRPDFLIRELRYYQSMHFTGKIFIGDSSNKSLAKLLTDTLPQFTNSFEIQYYYLPDFNDAQVVQFLAQEVTTSYVVFIADDDFLVPAGVEECIEFLNNNLDYVAAHGIGILVGANDGIVEGAGPYRQPIIDGTTAAQRLTDHLIQYSVSLFSVHRTETWREMYKDISKVKDKSFGSELLPCCSSVIEGKIKQLDGLYLVRQGHNARYVLPGWFKWITSEAWYPGYVIFQASLSEAIAKKDGVSIGQAKQVVEQAFSVYLAGGISKRTQDHSKISWWGNLRPQIARRLPSAQKAWQTMRGFFSPKYVSVISLPTLLNPYSPYHSDFMPVYRAISSLLIDSAQTKEQPNKTSDQQQ